MIKIKEFRVGNHLLVNDEICTVTFVNADDGFAETPCLGYQAKEGTAFKQARDAALAAVPLTDDLLRRLGYTFHSYHKMWQHPKLPKDFTLELDADYGTYDFARRPVTRGIKCLHTLENLYFALFGEELRLAKEPIAEKLTAAPVADLL